MSKNQLRLSGLFLGFMLANMAMGQRLKTASIFGDNMVIQQQINAPVWGIASPGEQIRVEFAGFATTGQADQNGKWMVYMPVLKAGGPFNFKVSGSQDSLRFTNVMVGEVWLASGQSNMNMTIAKVVKKESVVAHATENNIRVFTVPKNVSVTPLQDVDMTEWKVSNAENVLNFSAVAYFFAQHLSSDKDVAVGIINASRSGTPAEAWTSADMLFTLADFKPKIIDQQFNPQDWASLEASQVPIAKRYRQMIDSSNAGIEAGVHLPLFDDAQWATADYPLLASDIDMNRNGLVWFRKVINVPALYSKNDLRINLGRIVFEDITYLNGYKIGAEKREANRIYTIPAKYLKPGKNVIAVRLLSEWGYGRIGNPGDEPMLYSSDKKFVLSLKGKWSYHVSIEPALPIMPNFALQPASLFNGMIAPIIPYGIKGALWYQGEGNSGNTEQYKTLLPALFTDWRVRWKQGYFPFLLVQLPNYAPGGNNWAKMREVQASFTQYPNVGMAVAIDLGVPYDVHPANKEPVGKRLYDVAKKIAYGDNIICAGPGYKSMRIVADKIYLQFNNIGAGIELRSHDASASFSVAGADQQFYAATNVQIVSNEIIVSCSAVSKPVAIRYAWSGSPMATVYNLEGLPGSPFRTDNFEN